MIRFRIIKSILIKDILSKVDLNILNIQKKKYLQLNKKLIRLLTVIAKHNKLNQQ